MMKQKIAVMLAATFLAAGCATSIDNAGYTEYTIKASGNGGYDLTVKDGKQRAAQKLQFDAVNGGVSFQVTDVGVEAAAGQAVAAKAWAAFPVTDLANILLGTRAGK